LWLIKVILFVQWKETEITEEIFDCCEIWQSFWWCSGWYL
jgi:hypothetical protein